MKIKINYIHFFLVIIVSSTQFLQPEFETNSISEKIEIEDLINFSTSVLPTIQHQLLRMHNLPFIINTITNTADNVPSIQDSLEIIEKNIFSYDTNEIQKILYEILNILKITYKVLEINKEHEKFKNPIPADFLKKINTYEYKIYNLIHKINQKKLSDQGSFLPPLIESSDITLSSNQKVLTLSQASEFITSHDFKEIKDSHKSAFILFLECYIIFHKYNKTPLHVLQPLIQEDSLEKICKKIMSLGNTPETHDHLITVQKALQLAIFIANKNFKLNALNLIPSKITSLFDTTVNILMFQEKIVSELCKDQNLGATDLYSQKDKAEKIQQKFDAENNAALIGLITVAGLLAGTHYIIIPSIYKDLNLLHKETLTAIQLLKEQLSHQKNS